MKHTQGKWIIKYDFNVFNEKGRLVAACGGHSSNVDSDKVHDENIANAQMVAAAPEMYKTLKATRDYMAALSEFIYDLKPLSSYQAVINGIDAAVGKAEGGE